MINSRVTQWKWQVNKKKTKETIYADERKSKCWNDFFFLLLIVMQTCCEEGKEIKRRQHKTNKERDVETKEKHIRTTWKKWWLHASTNINCYAYHVPLIQFINCAHLTPTPSKYERKTSSGEDICVRDSFMQLDDTFVRWKINIK